MHKKSEFKLDVTVRPMGTHEKETVPWTPLDILGAETGSTPIIEW